MNMLQADQVARDARYAAIEDSLRGRAFEQARIRAQDLLRLAPDDPDALRLLGAALNGAGRHGEGEAAIRRALALRPDDPRMHNSLGAALHASGDRARAIAAFRRATEVAPTFAPSWQNLATLLIEEEDNAGALHALDRLLALQPQLLRARILRSDVLRRTGGGAETAAEYRRIIADHPESAWAWYGLANLKSVPFSSDDIAQMQQLHAASADPRERMALGFALAKALEDDGRYADAFAHLTAANAAARREMPWNAIAFSAAIDAILAAFPAAAAAPPNSGRGAIFIVSLPRSGSTLVEQILSSHSQVAGGGELPCLDDVIQAESRQRGQREAAWTRAATTADWERLGADYLQRTTKWRDPQRSFLTDKTPANWMRAGAALAMLPQARIVNCRRNRLEAGFSCYKQLFTGGSTGFSYAIEDIGAYWRDYDRACRHWQAHFPQRFFDLSYERLQAEPEPTIRALLDFCGLDFEPACLTFHENRRAVSTLSAAQVREPLRRDTARTHKYGGLLDPLRSALGLPPFAAPAATEEY